MDLEIKMKSKLGGLDGANQRQAVAIAGCARDRRRVAGHSLWRAMDNRSPDWRRRSLHVGQWPENDWNPEGARAERGRRSSSSPGTPCRLHSAALGCAVRDDESGPLRHCIQHLELSLIHI